jgi:hypothetical protein
MDLKKLQQRILPRWRVQNFSKNYPSAQCIAYIDARDAMRILDQVVGPGNWQDDYKMVGDQRFCGVGIRTSDGWVWKWDTGSESNVEAQKGEASDSFKRACVKWGIGRFLYELDIQTVKLNEKKTGTNYPYIVDENGKRIYDLSQYINSKIKSNNWQEV